LTHFCQVSGYNLFPLLPASQYIPKQLYGFFFLMLYSAHLRAIHSAAALYQSATAYPIPCHLPFYFLGKMDWMVVVDAARFF
jgi:hypothetical protein